MMSPCNEVHIASLVCYFWSTYLLYHILHKSSLLGYIESKNHQNKETKKCDSEVKRPAGLAELEHNNSIVQGAAAEAISAQSSKEKGIVILYQLIKTAAEG